MRSGIVTARSAAIVAENKPVYVFQLRHAIAGREMRAHKNQDPVCILLAVFGIALVLFLSSVGIHGIEWP